MLHFGLVFQMWCSKGMCLSAQDVDGVVAAVEIGMRVKEYAVPDVAVFAAAFAGGDGTRADPCAAHGSSTLDMVAVDNWLHGDVILGVFQLGLPMAGTSFQNFGRNFDGDARPLACSLAHGCNEVSWWRTPCYRVCL